MDIRNKIGKLASTVWSDDKVRNYLNAQFPDEKIKWIVMSESGLYGYVDCNEMEFACADDDDLRSLGIVEFLIRNGGSYVSNK